VPCKSASEILTLLNPDEVLINNSSVPTIEEVEICSVIALELTLPSKRDALEIPETKESPLTVNVAVGFVVPIPTLVVIPIVLEVSFTFIKFAN
jgi:hypothetical protein